MFVLNNSPQFEIPPKLTVELVGDWKENSTRGLVFRDFGRRKIKWYMGWVFWAWERAKIQTKREEEILFLKVDSFMVLNCQNYIII
jgi:hypothetical protein